MAAEKHAGNPSGLVTGFPGVLQRYYTIWERTVDEYEHGAGMVLAVHNNGLGVLMMGPRHALFRAVTEHGAASVRISDGSDSIRDLDVPEGLGRERKHYEETATPTATEEATPTGTARARKRPRDEPSALSSISVSGSSKKGAPRVRTGTRIAVVVDGKGRSWPVVAGANGRVLEANKRLEADAGLLLRGLHEGGQGHLLVLDVDGNLRKRLDPSSPPEGWTCLHRSPAMRGTADDEDGDG